MPEYDDDTLENRFDLYGALWMACSEYHSGMHSRGYRILSRLERAGYKPGIRMDAFKSEQQEMYYEQIVANYGEAL